MIKSHLLYQLSYAPGTGPESLRKRASFSKATPRCPANRQGFSRPSARLEHTKKPPESGGFYCIAGDGRHARLEPLGIASPTVVPIAVMAIHAMLETMVPPAVAAEPPHVGQEGKAPFLAVVEGLVERVGGVRDLLQRGRRGRHIVGTFAQARHRIVRLLRIL